MIRPSARIFPLGTVLEGETADYNPNNFYIDGVWEVTQKGMVSIGLDTSQSEFNAIGKTGGSKMHTLTVNQIPSHNHSAGILPDNQVNGGGRYYFTPTGTTNGTIKINGNSIFGTTVARNYIILNIMYPVD